MDDELRKYLIAMEERMFKHIDARFEHVDARFEHVDARFEHVDARIEHVETTLLTEFHKWASPVESKLRTHRSWFYEVDAEVEALKERIRKLEGGAKPPQ
jgi:uncharacterized protein YdcH (DUF465 family)